MDERLSAIRSELEAGTISPHSLVLLFNTSSEAERAGDLTTLQATLELTRAIAAATEGTLEAEADRLAHICEQSLANVRQPQADTGPDPLQATTCPDCGNELPPNALRCRRCGHRFF